LKKMYLFLDTLYSRGIGFRKDHSMRLAKLIAQSRLVSRRGAEELIVQRKVTVNGLVALVTTPVTTNDTIMVNGKKLSFKEIKKYEDQVFLCYKMRGELVTYSDPENRPCIFDRLAQMGLPRNLISAGRLDFQSEGLLVLTTDGNYARQLELPSNEIIRTYRARIRRGEFDEIAKKKLDKGIRLADSGTNRAYKPIFAQLAHSQRSSDGNLKQWLDVSVTEGQYREVRKALGSLGMIVDRLIRIGFGPYKLGDLKKGHVLRVPKQDLGLPSLP